MTKRIPAQVFPPGHFIREEMKARGWSLLNLAQLTRFIPDLLYDVIYHASPLFPGMAEAFAQLFSTSADYWLDLERAWREHEQGG